MRNRHRHELTLRDERDLNECLFRVFWPILGISVIVGFGVAFLIAFC